MKDLKHFLISKFMQIVVVCAAAEAIIFYVLSKTLFKWVLVICFDTDDIAHISLGKASLALGALLVSSLISLVGFVLPKNIAGSMEAMLRGVNNFTAGIFDLPNGASDLADMSFPMRLFLLALLIAILALILIPYAIAAVHFSYIVFRELKKIEDEQKAEQEEYTRKRNLMLSDIAHDLRTPMTSLVGYAKALDDGLVSEERKKEIYASMLKGTGRMNDLINLLFDYVKLDSDGYTLTRESMDVCEMVRECTALAYQDIEDNGMELDIDVPDEPVIIDADRVQLSRVISNLITNAIRHNAPGTGIGVYLTRDSEIIRIMICDNGDLIDASYAKHIFEPFVTGDESRNSKGGSGLGLSIAYRIVELHGYRLKLIQRPDMSKYRKVASYSKMFMVTIPV